MTRREQIRCGLSALVCLCAFGCDVAPSTTIELSAVARPATMPAAAPAVVAPSVAAPSTDFAAAMALAQREAKPLLIMFTADWCTHCRQVLAEMSTSPELQSLTGQFVCVRVDVDADAARCEEFRVRNYPTIVAATPRGVPFARVTGAQGAEKLASELRAALITLADRRKADEALQR